MLPCFIYLYLQRGREERKIGKHQCVGTSHMPPTGDQACNAVICPDWESNQWPVGSKASTQSAEQHQPGLGSLFCPLIYVSVFMPVPCCFDYYVCSQGWKRMLDSLTNNSVTFFFFYSLKLKPVSRVPHSPHGLCEWRPLEVTTCSVLKYK